MQKLKHFVFTTANKLIYQLTEKEKRFSEIYCQFGVSGIEAVIQAGYKVSTKNTAYSIASENLRKPKILDYIKSLYKEYKLTDEDVMREHLFLITQHESLSSKARAIDMYYKKNGMYSLERPEAVTPRPYEDYTDEELEETINKKLEKLGYRK